METRLGEFGKEKGHKEVVELGVVDPQPPKEVLNVLEKVTRFANDAVLKPPELISLFRSCTTKAEEGERGTCILERVESLSHGLGKRTSRCSTDDTVVSFCLERRLNLLVSDKEACLLECQKIYFETGR